MRVLTLSNYFECHGGGIEAVAGKLARGLARRGLSVHWMATDPDLPSSEARLTLETVAGWNGIERRTGLPLPVPTRAAAASIRARVEQADVLLLHETIYVANRIAAAHAQQRGIPALVVQHIGAMPFRSSLLRAVYAAADRLAVRPALARADAVVCISESTRRHYAAVPFRSPAALVFNGVDTAVFREPTEAEREAARAAWALDDRPTVAFLGRFVEKKGLQHVEVMARSAPDILWLFAGSGPLDPRAWSLPNVRVLGKLDRPDVVRLLHAADALVLPSVGEGWPLVVQEAMACGLPPVIGDVTAAADPAAAPFVVRAPVDPAAPTTTGRACLAALRTAWASETPEKRSGRAAYARTHYGDWDSVSARYETILNQLVSERPRRP